MTNERNVTLVVKCEVCGEYHELAVTEESFLEYMSPNRRHIQDIFPYLSNEERELLISGTCSKCWAEMFSAFEEEDA